MCKYADKCNEYEDNIDFDDCNMPDPCPFYAIYSRQDRSKASEAKGQKRLPT